jgi:hypothetical protein
VDPTAALALRGNRANHRRSQELAYFVLLAVVAGDRRRRPPRPETARLNALQALRYE